MGLHENIAACHRCPRRGPIEGGRCVCTADDRPIGQHAAELGCPLGYYEAAPAERPQREPAPRPASAWAAVRRTWLKAESLAKSLASRGVFARRVAPAVRALRVLSCHGDPVAGAAPCPARGYSVRGRFHFCNDCGCGESELARLNAPGSPPDRPTLEPGDYSKLDYPHLECPRRRPGFSNAEPAGGPAAPPPPAAP